MIIVALSLHPLIQKSIAPTIHALQGFCAKPLLPNPIQSAFAPKNLKTRGADSPLDTRFLERQYSANARAAIHRAAFNQCSDPSCLNSPRVHITQCGANIGLWRRLTTIMTQE